MINHIKKNKPSECTWLHLSSGVLTISRSATQQLMTADRTPKQEHQPWCLFIMQDSRHTFCLEKTWHWACEEWHLLLSSSFQAPNSNISTISLTEARGTLGGKLLIKWIQHWV